MSEVAELIELPPAETALQEYQTPNGLDPYIERVRQEVMGQPVDLTTKKGRDAVASRAFKVRKIKAAMDGLGKQQVDNLKEVPKLIDAERKRMRDAFDAMAEEVRRPLTEWEEAEDLRVQKHRCNVGWFPGQVEFCRHESAETIRAVLADIDAKHVDESWEEFEAEAHRAKARSLDELTAHLAAREKHEAEQAELAELRRKQAEQEQKDREARIAREAEQRAKDAAEAARVAEVKRQEAAQAAAAEAQRRREADTAHKAGINNAALAAFIEHGLPEDCAKQAIVLIARGLIPAVQIHY
ncbi:hypothetical protein CBF45_07375 [Bordetella sp. J329]|nr:hypothetical protein CBF45_07375 [Bordetella sp. J329]